MVKVTYEKEKLLKVIEMLRLEPNMDAEMMLSLIETEEVQSDKKPRKLVKRDKQSKCDNMQYTQEERDLFLRLVTDYREPAFVPTAVINDISAQLQRTPGAIVTQLYIAEKKIEGKRRNEKIREHQEYSNSDVKSSEPIEANREERKQPDYKVQVHTVG